MELLRQGAAFDYGYLGLATEDCLKSRMRENCTSGSVRGSRQPLHSRNNVKGVSRLSTRLKKMRSQRALQIRILDLCDDHDLSLNALSARCGITQSTLNNIITGRNNSITVQTVLRICRGLDMELEEFFDDDIFRDIEQEIY